MIIKEAKEVEPTENNNEELEKWFGIIIEKIEDIRVPSDKITRNNKGLLLELKKFKDEIVDEIDSKISKKKEREKERFDEDYELEIPSKKRSKVPPSSSDGCQKCGLDYGNCKCPKIVEEKIDRRILFDYAKDGERSPLHETYDYSDNFNQDFYNNQASFRRN